MGITILKITEKEIFDVNIYGMMQLLDYGVKAKIKNIYLRLPVEYMASWGSLLWKMNRLFVSDSLNFYQNTKIMHGIISSKLWNLF